MLVRGRGLRGIIPGKPGEPKYLLVGLVLIKRIRILLLPDNAFLFMQHISVHCLGLYRGCDSLLSPHGRRQRS